MLKRQRRFDLSPHERLFLSGQLAAFERAVLEERRGDAVALLTGAGVNREHALKATQDVFSNPRKYGYCPGGCLK